MSPQPPSQLPFGCPSIPLHTHVNWLTDQLCAWQYNRPETKEKKVLDFFEAHHIRVSEAERQAGSKQDLQEQCWRCVYAAHSFYFTVLWYLSMCVSEVRLLWVLCTLCWDGKSPFTCLLVVLHAMQDLRSPIRGSNLLPAVEAQSLNRLDPPGSSGNLPFQVFSSENIFHTQLISGSLCLPIQ